MKLRSPVIITPRLMPGVMVGKAFVSIEYAPRPGREGRTRYRYHIDIGRRSYSGDDLESGMGRAGLQEGLESLLSFLGAAAESYDYRQRTGHKGENEHLFKPAVVKWASENSDEISMLQLELVERKGLIKE